MPIPVRYNARSLLYRKTATLLTMVSVALSVSLLVVLLSVQQGFQEAMVATGRPDNVICLREGAPSEGESGIQREDYNKLRSLPGVAKAADGSPLAAPEMYAGVNLARVGEGTTNVALRGVAAASLEVRDQVRITEGRMLRPGTRELVVGRGVRGRVRGAELGGVIDLQNETWTVVGVLDSGGAAFDSEIWGDVELMLQLFNRTIYSTVIFRVEDPAAIGRPATYSGDVHERTVVEPATGLMGRIQSDVAAIKPMVERDYFASQAGFLGVALAALTTFLTILMGAGAIAGCLNTMFAAVMGRSAEIGGLLALGFRPFHIFLGFLFEALLLCLAGGALGVLATLPLDGVETGTTNWQTFTELAFRLDVNGTVIAIAFGLALMVGLVGGAFPAWRAARLKPVDALRR